MTSIINQYLKSIEQELSAGSATEHTHRPALKALLEGLVSGVRAINEPKHMEEIDAAIPEWPIQ